MTNIELSVIKTGVITGRLLDVRGSPVADVPVEGLEVRYIDGRRSAVPVVGSARTDDRGIYRLGYLPPGDYYVRAEPRTGAWSYYPNSIDLQNASLVRVVARTETVAVDWVKPIETLWRKVSGTVEIPTDWALPPKAFYVPFEYYLLPQSGLAETIKATSLDVSAQGAFEFLAAPGSYDLLLVRRNNIGISHFGRVRIDVQAHDVDGIRVAMESGVNVRGKVVLEDGEGNLHPGIGMSVRLIAPKENVPVLLTPGSAKTDALGNFLVSGLIPSRYAFDVYELPTEDSYVSRVETTGGHADDILVTIRSTGASVEGAVYDEHERSVPGTPVVLVPVPDLRWNPTAYHSTVTDAFGKFTVRGIPPGEYKLFAWENLPRPRGSLAAEVGPDFFEPYENLGSSITLDQKSHFTNLRVNFIHN